MKIFYITSQYWPFVGGIEVLAQETLPALRELGHEITVVTDFGDKPVPAVAVHHGIQVHRFPLLAALASHNIRELISIQRQIAAVKTAFQPDLVHLNFGATSAYFHLRTQNVAPAPLFTAVHSDMSGCRAESDTVLGQSLRNADWICSVSRATHQDVLCLAPEKERVASVILNGLPMPELAPAPLPFEPAHILCLGRLVPEKGFDIALGAFALLVEKYPAARMTIVGEGPMQPALEARTTVLGLGERVTFTGRLERAAIAPMINTATMVVVPSRYREPFALVALEAAQMARPVVATRWGGLVESVADGESGVLVENENRAAFAQAMQFLLENPATARAMGERGRARARDLFGLERCVREYDALYKKITTTAAASGP